MAIDLAHYTITGASDWPMLKEMLSGMRFLFILLWGAIGGLITFIGILGGLAWRDLRKQLATQRTEDQGHFDECKKSCGVEFGYVWSALDLCCPRSPETKAAVEAAQTRQAAENLT